MGKAEKLLEFADEKRNHGVMLLHLIDKNDLDMNIRVAGAIAFKNYVKRNWAPNEVSISVLSLNLTIEWKQFQCSSSSFCSKLQTPNFKGW